MWWFCGLDKLLCVFEVYFVYFLVLVYQGFQDQIRLLGSYKKRQYCEDKYGSD